MYLDVHWVAINFALQQQKLLIYSELLCIALTHVLTQVIGHVIVGTSL